MKKIVYLLVIASVLLSCQNQFHEDGFGQELSGGTFVALTESAPVAKSVMTPDSNRNGVYNIKWVEGDEVLVSDGSTAAVYYAFPTKDATRATLTSIASVVPSKGALAYYAVYPATEGAEAAAGKCTVVIPAEQKLSENGFSMPMVGRAGSDRVLSFRNAAALIRIKPSNHCDIYDGVKIVRIEVASATINIAGAIDFTFDKDGIPVVSSTERGTGKVVLDCGEGLPFTENFFVAVAPGTYGDLNVTLHTNGGGSQSFTIDEKEYKRSNYTTVPINVNNLAIYEPANCYLIRKPGTYKFPVNVMGNGKIVPESTVTSSEIDVETIKGFSTEVISQLGLKVSELSTEYTINDVKLSDGYISFSVPAEFTSGNIRIGVYSTEDCAPGTCIWQWHIWANPDVAELASSGARFLNMNLGSLQSIANLSEYAGSDAGLHYQWGRKDPFHAAVISEDESGTVLKDLQSSLGYSVNVNCTDVNENRSSLQNAIAYPTVFYTGKSWVVDKYDRKSWNHTDQTVPLWGAPTVADVNSLEHMDVQKTMFDPCPPGYHVSAPKALNEAKGLLPADGYRLVPADKTVERLDQIGTQKYYWCASAHATGYMNAIAIANNKLDKRTKSYALPVRPQKQ